MKRKLLKKLILLTTGCLLMSQAAHSEQLYFDTPEQAANRLVIALARADQAEMADILGSEYQSVLSVEGIDRPMVDRFLNGWADYHVLVSSDDKTRILAVGFKGWTLPIPIVREVEGWRFDTATGQSMIKVRRIGRNELSAMQTALAYHDAQMEYAAEDHDGDGILEYAQRFISSPGKHDGLYWETAEGEPESPTGALLAGHEPGKDYHGYYYRILTGQGVHAPGGAMSYLQGDSMVNGFALIAWPAEYRDTGVMSFLLGRNGILYEADLGSNGAAFASAVPSYDPDARWSPVAAGFSQVVED
ncbi:MAG: DUF2950 domain-containing protein [Candidatus Thiodiazotropha sp.]